MAELGCRSRSARAATRRELGGGAVLSVEQAVQLLPWSTAFCRAWLRQQRLISRVTVEGDVRECVVWAAVQERLWPSAESLARPVEVLPPAGSPGTLPRMKTARRR